MAVGQGRMDPGTAAGIHARIDQTEGWARHECEKGDPRGIWKVNRRYGDIDQWIDRSTGDWRREWWGNR